MDITAGFEPAVPGSSPGGSTKRKVCAIVFNVCGYGLVVEHILAKDETGVRFSLSAQRFSQSPHFPVFFTKSLDNGNLKTARVGI